MADSDGAADAIVVLSAGVNARCSLNMFGIQRVLVAAELYHRQRAPLVVFSGGRARRSACSVSAAMADLARRLDIPDDRIRVENQSTSTWTNAERSDALLRTLGVSRLVLVTDQLHMRRAAASFARFGYTVERRAVPIVDSHRDNVEMLAMGLREYAALAYYRYRGHLDAAPAPRALVEAIAPREPGRMLPLNLPMTESPTVPIVLLGASYAGGWSLSLVGKHRVINKGVTGQQTFELLQRFERDVISEAPGAVVVWGFINDIYRSPTADLPRAMARARDSFRAMIGLARAHGIEPILATEVTITGPDSLRESVLAFVGPLLNKESYAQRINRHVLDLNEWLRELARQEGLLILDLQPVLADRDGARARRFATEDGSHISPSGYEALTNYATPVLQHHLQLRDRS